jgi:hypothetical protein
MRTRMIAYYKANIAAWMYSKYPDSRSRGGAVDSLAQGGPERVEVELFPRAFVALNFLIGASCD